MAYASVTYTSASGTTFALTNSNGDPIPYLKQSDISVTVNGVVLTQGTQYTFNTAGTAIVLASSVSGATVIINRVTDITDATVVYTPGSTLTAQDLNNADNQIRYGLQEFSDTYGALTSGTGDLQALGGFIGSSEVWSSDNAHAATTAAIDARVDGKIDTALTTDVVAGDSITVTDNSPGSGQITIGVTNASISTAKLVDSSVTTAKIADSNVTTVKIADSNVTTAKIADANVTTAKIADSAITSAKIADGTIVAADLASDSVTTAKILDANVTTAKIADANVTTGKLADGSVTSAKIADGTIVAGDIASDAVTTAKILDSNVTESKIATGAVTTTKIADSAVTAIKIPDGVLTTAKLTGSTVVTAAEQATSTPDDTSFFTTSASDARYVNATGDTMSGALAMGSNKITGLGTPTASGDAATKGYVDSSIAAASIPDADYGDITVSGTGSVWSIDTGAVTSAKIADDTIVNADINTSAAIAHSKLASIVAGRVLLGNASNVPTATALSGDVTVDSSGVTAIGSGVIVDGDISGTAAIALSKLGTGALPTNITVASANIVDGTIVDADISGSAEIAVSKLADGAARQLLQTDAAGTGVEWTDNVDIPGTLDVTGAATFDSTANITGNFTVDTNTLYVDATNNRVGIGTTSPGTILDIRETATGATTAVSLFNTDNTNSTLQTARIGLSPDSRGAALAGLEVHKENADFSTSAARNVSLAFNVLLNNAKTEAARIDSSGRLLVGTSTSINSNAKLQTYASSGTVINHIESGSLANNNFVGFQAEAQSRRGQLGVFKHSGITNNCAFLYLQEEDGNNAYIWADNSGVLRISALSSNVGTTGGVVVGAQTSDERLKNILGPVEYGLETLRQLDPVRYSLKSEPETEKLGFIAQQVQPLIPESVFDTNEHIEGEPEDAPTRLGIEYVALIPVLVKAIKELSAEVDALKAQLS